MRENRRVRALKLPKNIERLYKEGKCRDCAVVVTRMDFAKILGKFTKVKIQYESSSPKAKNTIEATSPNSNARLKSNENGMVLIHRNAYNQHPVKDVPSNKKGTKGNQNQAATPRPNSNVLKENNRLKKTPFLKDKNSNINISSCNVNKRQTKKRYGIIFVKPLPKNKNDVSKTTLASLVPLLDKSILPTEEWCVDYLPRSEEPMDDKVYDRIAAELEDLMFNEPAKVVKPNTTDSKVDEFPSIMDILNDNTSDSSKPNDQSTSVEFKTNLESSDVEAMLLGKSEDVSKELTPMEVVNADMGNLIEDVAQLNATEEPVVVSIPEIQQPVIDEFVNPHSPSILDEALQKGIEEHLPCNPISAEAAGNESITEHGTIKEGTLSSKSEDPKAIIKPMQKFSVPTNITHLIFKKNVNGRCLKSIICPKNLKYIVELDGKTVEFLGAPKVISSLEDLQVLIQIVNETELQNLYVCH